MNLKRLVDVSMGILQQSTSGSVVFIRGRRSAKAAAWSLGIHVADPEGTMRAAQGEKLGAEASNSLPDLGLQRVYLFGGALTP